MTVAAQARLGYVIGYFIDAAYGRASIDLFASKVVPELAS